MDERIPARLSPKEGRRFAFTVGAAFGVLAAVSWWRAHVPMAVTLGTISTVLLLAGIVSPGKLGRVYRGWMTFASILSKVTTPIFMALTYYLVLAPVGFLVRLFGSNPIVRKQVNGSFWIVRPEGAGRKSDLKRQF